MTDHADTIRRALNLVIASDRANPLWDDAAEALTALDSFVAERQQAIDARDIQHERANALGTALDGQLAENDRLEACCEQAIDALRETLDALMAVWELAGEHP